MSRWTARAVCTSAKGRTSTWSTTLEASDAEDAIMQADDILSRADHSRYEIKVAEIPAATEEQDA